MADSKRFIFIDKLVLSIRAFVQLFNQKNCAQVYKIYNIIELEKIYTLITKDFCNFDAY